MQGQTDVVVVLERLGTLLVAQGRGTAALEAYRKALATNQKLVEADPANADRQHNAQLSAGRPRP